MQMSKQGLIELANYEAMSHTKYIDSGGVHTIGIGMTDSEIKDLKSWSWNKVLSTKECIDMYKKGLKKYEDAVNTALKVPVTQNQFDALVSITYNIGTGGMKNSTFMKLVNAKANADNITSAMKRWNQDNGRIVKGLVNRREKESKMFKYGTYEIKDDSVTLITVNSSHKPIYKGRENIGAYL